MPRLTGWLKHRHRVAYGPRFLSISKQMDLCCGLTIECPVESRCRAEFDTFACPQRVGDLTRRQAAEWLERWAEIRGAR
jgi:hypothetical protein